MHGIETILMVLFALFMGGLPVGYKYCQWVTGNEYFDIRDHGSGNIGATNCFRVLGFWKALPVFIFDTLKGWLPCFIAIRWLGNTAGVLCFIGAFVGHWKSWYFFWKEGHLSGGKSVATAFGSLLAFQPLVATISFAVWVLALLITRTVSLSSIIASCTPVVCAGFLHLQKIWFWLFVILPFAIGATHIRNILRMLTGHESKITDKKGEPHEVVYGFAIHSLSIDDLKQIKYAKWLADALEIKIISIKKVRWLLAHSKMIEVGEVRGISTKTGQKVRVLLFGVPMLPDQIMDNGNDPKKNGGNYYIVLSLLKAIVVEAQRRGCSVLGLGALLGSVKCYKDGTLGAWAKERGLKIVIDNGAALTAAATIYILKKILANRCLKLEDVTVAVFGGSGSIGMANVRYLAGKTKGKIMAIGRDLWKMKDLGEIATRLTPNDLSQLKEADVVIFNTSSVKPIITPENVHLLKHGAILIDVAVPPDVDDAVLIPRPDLEVYRSGLGVLPGEYESDIDFHFGKERDKMLLPACFFQGMVLAITRRFEMASTEKGLNDPAKLDFVLENALAMGVEFIVSRVSEPTLFSGITKGEPKC